jgi:hypothetical protein
VRRLLAAASSTAFSTIVLGQLVNAFACRSEHRDVGDWSLRGNRLLLWAVASELVLLVVFLAVPPVAGVLGHAVPTNLGWASPRWPSPPSCWLTQRRRRSSVALGAGPKALPTGPDDSADPTGPFVGSRRLTPRLFRPRPPVSTLRT